MKNLLNRLKNVKRRTWVILAVVVVALVAFFVISGARSRAQTVSQLQTTQAERGSLTATVGATGTVRARQTAILSWQTTGTIGSVNVRPGDEVQAGTVLASLTSTSLPQSVIMAQADLVSAQKALDDLLNSQTDKANAQLALANAQKNYETTKANFNYQTSQRATAETIKNAKAQITLDDRLVDLLQRKYNDTSGLSDDNPVRANAYQSLYTAWKQRDHDVAVYNWYIGKPTQTDLNVLTANLALAKATLDDAQRTWDSLKDGPSQSDVAAAQARVDAARATVALAQLSAPFAGTVTEVNGLVGDQVAPGTKGFRIDDMTSMEVDVQISEVDINTIRVSQPVSLSFDAISGKTYTGKVIDVSQAGDVVQGAVNFTVTVELTDADAMVKPGMTAAVNVTVKQLDNVLLVPNRAVRLVNSQRVVYVLRNGLTQEVKITLGASSDTVSEVVGGDLKVGDLIILNPPSALFNRPSGGGGGGGRVVVGGG
jgi:HlyD family secretion protein